MLREDIRDRDREREVGGRGQPAGREGEGREGVDGAVDERWEEGGRWRRVLRSAEAVEDIVEVKA